MALIMCLSLLPATALSDNAEEDTVLYIDHDCTEHDHEEIDALESITETDAEEPGDETDDVTSDTFTDVWNEAPIKNEDAEQRTVKSCADPAWREQSRLHSRLAEPGMAQGLVPRSLYAPARAIHLSLANWGFVLMCVHAGSHLEKPLRRLSKGVRPELKALPEQFEQVDTVFPAIPTGGIHFPCR